MARALRSKQGSSLQGYPKRLTKKPPFAIVQVLPVEMLDKDFDPLLLWYDAMAQGDAEESSE